MAVMDDERIPWWAAIIAPAAAIAVGGFLALGGLGLLYLGIP
jgi:hypothetical protein